MSYEKISDNYNVDRNLNDMLIDLYLEFTIDNFIKEFSELNQDKKDDFLKYLSKCSQEQTLNSLEIKGMIDLINDYRLNRG